MDPSLAPLVGSEPPLVLGVVLYPMMTALDFVGPLASLSTCCTVHMIARTLDPVTTDSQFSVVPTTTFADCPEHLDILMIPGGFGSNAAMQDQQMLGFLRSRGAHATYVTSVCSGSTVLGAAGLLDGYESATHWAYYPVLDAMNIATNRARVVVDGNRMSGGGVTAGIDFGLTLLAKLRGDDVAKRVQLLLEYDPQPPFCSGHPRTAEARITDELTEWIKPFTDEAEAIGRASVQARSMLSQSSAANKRGVLK